MLASLDNEITSFMVKYNLTKRESDITRLAIVQGGNVKSIAGILGIAENTVHNHFKNIFRRLQVNTKQSLLSKFITEMSVWEPAE